YTPLYASPQQMAGAAPDPRDDVHALGVIWYQLLTGNLLRGRPGGKSWQRHFQGRGMSAAWLDLLMACMEEEPSDRPADGADLASRLGALLQSGGQQRRAARYVEEAFAQLKRGKYDRAIANYTEAIRLDPKRPEAYVMRGVV